MERKNLKGISKAICVLAKICKVFIIIGIVGIAISAIVLPFVLKNIKVVGNEIKYNNKSVITYETLEDNNIQISIGGEKIDGIEDEVAFTTIKNFLDKNSMEKIIFSVEMCLVASIIYMVIVYIILNNVDKLFKNIREKDTPFIEDNVKHLRKMAGYMISALIISIVISTIINIMYNSDIALFDSSYSIITILVLFGLSHVFDYGMSLQKDSKKKIYE